MKILHTADWHLGRIFHALHLTDDQAFILDQFVRIAKDVSPDVIIIAGDIYDRAVPPVEAVKLLDDTLNRLISDIKTQVIIIAGNHDSPDRIGFGSQLLAPRGLHIAGVLDVNFRPVTINDKYGPVNFYLLPYAEPAIVRQLTGADCTDHNSAMNILTGKIRKSYPIDQRSVLCAHAFVAGGDVSESERPLNVGGSGVVDLSLFDGFSYVALGHLHRNQWLNETVHYAGSPMKYSFSESLHNKSVTFVELNTSGIATSESISLVPRHDVRTIKGILDNIINQSKEDPAHDDYLSISIEDKEPILDLLGKLRPFYPNVLNIERPGLSFQANSLESSIDHRTLTDLELFSAFFKQTTGSDLDIKQSEIFSEIIGTLQIQERESRS
ncbi:MAG: exonuclease SbcCD subunit D [Fibrobacter sp.]|nr:exonuclease SbcCD subunit D [Fibrobacter sp.]